jgi:hypothetical protein
LANIIIADELSDELVLLDGFSSTELDSVVVTSYQTSLRGVERFDGDNYIDGNVSDTLYRLDDFSTTIVDSVDISSLDTNARGITTDVLGNPMWGANISRLIYTMDGFSLTILSSHDVDVYESLALRGNAFDGLNIMQVGNDDTLRILDGETTSVDHSLDVNSVDTSPSDLGWDGTDTLWTGAAGDTFYKQEGKVTSTQLDSQSYPSSNMDGITIDDVVARLNQQPVAFIPRMMIY